LCRLIGVASGRDGMGAQVGTLYVVATPIGNREDITLRALRVLREVAVVAAEDTRHTGQLLTHHGIAARYLSLHQHNERDRAAVILSRLAAGEDVALVSDAGTPAVADPGAVLVAAVAAAGHVVAPIPGPSALIAAVSASGAITGPFTFAGFAPAKTSARREMLTAFATLPHPVVWYESPHRLAAWLADARAVCGEREIVLCRELTKLHEEITHTTLDEAIARLATSQPRGEYVIIVKKAAASVAPALPDDATLTEALVRLLASGLSPAAAAKEAARLTGRERAESYRLAVQLRGQRSDGQRSDERGEG